MRYTQYLLATALLYSCGNTPESDRWEPNPIPNYSQGAKALVEEFTGQDCIHCPEAARLLKDLSKLHGERLVWVSMHAERSGLVRPELSTAEANAYGEAFSLKRSLPGIMINRQALGAEGLYSQTRGLWAGLLERALSRTAQYSMGLKASLSADELFVEVSASPTSTSAPQRSLMLQLWLVEDIEAYQILPSGGKTDYQHHQVLRSALNGTWGEDYTAASFYRKTINIGGKLKDKERAKVLAFVYDKTSKEVLGVEILALGSGSDNSDNGSGEVSINRPLLQEPTVWYRSQDQDYTNGGEMICTKLERRPKYGGGETIELVSPFFYLMPGSTHGNGQYTLKATKLDHLEDKESGISQFCAAEQCLSNEDKATTMTSDEITISEAKPNDAQSVYVHYTLSPQALQREGRYKVRLDLYKGSDIISSLTLVFVYKP